MVAHVRGDGWCRREGGDWDSRREDVTKSIAESRLVHKISSSGRQEYVMLILGAERAYALTWMIGGRSKVELCSDERFSGPTFANWNGVTFENHDSTVFCM